ncbi:MAG TPA: methionyl-tRNA formyltransferase [Flavobacteriales bacterium]|nr:methionyl-tRNA formyltransferase [Flavobacteriales bacterium]
MEENRRIIFMGTPDFAVATLNALVADGLNVVAVVTAPDRPAGRGRQLRASAVKERAVELGLPVLQPEKLKDPAFNEELDRMNAALYVVVAFRMLPEMVWNKPPLGTVNLHGSLLPAYRGAAPINWAVIHGEAHTGVTTFRIQHEIDTGDMLLQERTPIGPDETAGDVHDRLMAIGASLMVRTVHGLFAAELHPLPQVVDQSAPPPTAPKLNNENMHVRFDRPARQAHDHVRGLSPYPGAWCTWTDPSGQAQHTKLLRTQRSDRSTNEAAGTLVVHGPRLFVACADQLLEIMELQAEGRKRMSAAEFLRGTRNVEGGILG